MVLIRKITWGIQERKWGDKRVEVRVLEDGFAFEGRRYRSLSAIAKEVTGTNWDGFLFFGRGGG